MTDPRAWLESVEAHISAGQTEAVLVEIASEVALLAARQAAAAAVFGGCGAIVPEEPTPEEAFLRFRARANKGREG